MKRLLVSLLALLYLAAGAGFTLREHYCMGQMVGAVIEHSGHYADSHRCDRCGMEKKSGDKGCCKDKVKTFKSSPDQVLAKALIFNGAPVIAALPADYTFYDKQPAFIAAACPAAPAHGPPLRSGLPIYLQVRCLRL